MVRASSCRAIAVGRLVSQSGYFSSRVRIRVSSRTAGLQVSKVSRPAGFPDESGVPPDGHPVPGLLPPASPVPPPEPTQRFYQLPDLLPGLFQFFLSSSMEPAGPGRGSGAIPAASRRLPGTLDESRYPGARSEQRAVLPGEHFGRALDFRNDFRVIRTFSSLAAPRFFSETAFRKPDNSLAVGSRQTASLFLHGKNGPAGLLDLLGRRVNSVDWFLIQAGRRHLRPFPGPCPPFAGSVGHPPMALADGGPLQCFDFLLLQGKLPFAFSRISLSRVQILSGGPIPSGCCLDCR